MEDLLVPALVIAGMGALLLVWRKRRRKRRTYTYVDSGSDLSYVGAFSSDSRSSDTSADCAQDQDDSNTCDSGSGDSSDSGGGSSDD